MRTEHRKREAPPLKQARQRPRHIRRLLLRTSSAASSDLAERHWAYAPRGDCSEEGGAFGAGAPAARAAGEEAFRERLEELDTCGGEVHAWGASKRRFGVEQEPRGTLADENESPGALVKVVVLGLDLPRQL